MIDYAEEEKLAAALEAMDGDASKLKITAETFGVNTSELRRAHIHEMREARKKMRSTPQEEDGSWTSIGRLTQELGIPKNTLRGRIDSDSPKWAHYESRPATVADKRRLKSYALKHVMRIRPGCGIDALSVEKSETPDEPKRTKKVDRIAELETHIKDLEASLGARDQLITDLRGEIERLQKAAPSRRTKSNGKTKQIARQLAQVQRGYAHIQQEHKRLLSHCREIEQQLQEHVNNSNATLTIQDDDYYDQLNDESVVVSTTNGEIRVWLDEGQHIRVHGAMNGERMTTKEFDDVLAALVAARWHQEDAPAVEDVEVAA